MCLMIVTFHTNLVYPLIHFLCCHQLAVICQFIQVLFSIAIYHFVILNRRTTSAYLMGWAVLIPLSLAIPYLMIDFYDLQNLSIKTIPSMLPISVAFRIVEAMYNTSPPRVEDNLLHYMIYYTAGSQHVWDLKTKTYATPTLHHMLTSIPKLIHYYLAVCLSLSFLFYTDFSPFPQSPVEQQNFHFNMDVLNPYHIANGYCFGGASCVRFQHVFCTGSGTSHFCCTSMPWNQQCIRTSIYDYSSIFLPLEKM